MTVEKVLQRLYPSLQCSFSVALSSDAPASLRPRLQLIIKPSLVLQLSEQLRREQRGFEEACGQEKKGKKREWDEATCGVKVFNNVQLEGGERKHFGGVCGLSGSIDWLLLRRNSSAFHYSVLNLCVCVFATCVFRCKQHGCECNHWKHFQHRMVHFYTAGLYLIQPAYIYYSLNVAHNVALLLLNEALLS